VSDVLRERAPEGLTLTDDLLALVREAYESPGRAYHTLVHLDELTQCFAELARADAWKNPREVYLAMLFHDAVYVAGDTDNEVKSTALARDAIARHLAGAGIDVERVVVLISLTAAHGKLTSGSVDREAALFLDCDMSILGSTPSRFDEYDAQVRQEYAGLPAEEFAAGRRAFLEGLLGKDRIYLSDWGVAHWEAMARINIERTLGD
jgi:predicted metal-dependent HD superfamily phosphohydrolase